jgi:hypothetical protein
MVSTTCHCGAVTVEIPYPPATLTQCDCSICRRYGTLWAYYREHEVRIDAADGATAAYDWGRKSLRFVRCAHCGCITHWQRSRGERDDRIGINARNFTPEQIGPARVRRLDGAVSEQYLDA